MVARDQVLVNVPAHGPALESVEQIRKRKKCHFGAFVGYAFQSCQNNDVWALGMGQNVRNELHWLIHTIVLLASSAAQR